MWQVQHEFDDDSTFLIDNEEYIELTVEAFPDTEYRIHLAKRIAQFLNES